MLESFIVDFYYLLLEIENNGVILKYESINNNWE